MNKTQADSNIHFFDDAHPKTPFEPTKPTPKHLKDLTSPPQLSASFTWKDLSSTFVKEGTWALHNNLMAFYAVTALLNFLFLTNFQGRRERASKDTRNCA